MVEPTRPPVTTSPALIHRHGRAQRAAHWWLAGTFALAMFTAPEDPRGDTAKLVVHVIAASALVVGLIVIALLGDRAALARDVKALMVFDATDRAWLRSSLRRGGAREPVRWGKFNTGQKAMAWALLVLTCGIILTGAVDALHGHVTAHPAFTVLAGVLIVGHLVMAIVNPATRPALRGMLRGSVDRAWAARHHAAWVGEMSEAPPREE